MNTALIDSAVWDKWRQFELTENSPGFFLDLLQTALASTPPLMKSLKEAFANQDLKNVIYFSHTLSSSCRSLGATQLASELKAIEWAGRSKPPEIKNELLPASEKMFEAFVEEIKREIARIKSA